MHKIFKFLSFLPKQPLASPLTRSSHFKGASNANWESAVCCFESPPTRAIHKSIKYNAGDSNADSSLLEYYDIVVSGGGMVGFAAACALGRSALLQNHKILLLESSKQRPFNLPQQYGNRVCALGSGTKNLLEKLGAWHHLTGMRVAPVKRMQVWESCCDAMISFSPPEGKDALAFIVENDVILESIKRQIPHNNVTISYGTTASNITIPRSFSEKVVIELKDGRQFRTDLLVGADGMNSAVRKSLGTNYVTWNYDQMGVVATLKIDEESENNVAWQKFRTTGPIAILPLSSGFCSLVWSTSTSNAKTLLGLNEEDFVQALNRDIWDQEPSSPLVHTILDRWNEFLNVVAPTSVAGGKQLPPCINGVVEGSVAAFPLGLGHAMQYMGNRTVLVGDAAHRVHPLAGQGVNLGFGDITDLVSVLETSVMEGSAIGGSRPLREYQSLRQRHNVVVMGGVDTLHRLYSSKWSPVVAGRAIGLATVDALQGVKSRLIQIAGG